MPKLMIILTIAIRSLWGRFMAWVNQPRKEVFVPVQIDIETSTHPGHCTLAALCQDGSIWVRELDTTSATCDTPYIGGSGWVRLPDIE